jgi:hypothetical protein
MRHPCSFVTGRQRRHAASRSRTARRVSIGVAGHKMHSQVHARLSSVTEAEMARPGKMMRAAKADIADA